MEAMNEGDATEATEYPIDTEHLHKGSRVSAETIEGAFGVVRGSDGYRLAALRIRDYIARRLADRGERVTVIQERDEIAILTDEEASAYNARRFKITRRQGERSFVRLGQVDRANLGEDARKRHDRDLVVIGRRIQADRQARRESAPKVMERATPGALPEPEKP